MNNKSKQTITFPNVGGDIFELIKWSEDVFMQLPREQHIDLCSQPGLDPFFRMYLNLNDVERSYLTLGDDAILLKLHQSVRRVINNGIQFKEWHPNEYCNFMTVQLMTYGHLLWDFDDQTILDWLVSCYIRHIDGEHDDLEPINLHDLQIHEDGNVLHLNLNKTFQVTINMEFGRIATQEIASLNVTPTRDQFIVFCKSYFATLLVNVWRSHAIHINEWGKTDEEFVNVHAKTIESELTRTGFNFLKMYADLFHPDRKTMNNPHVVTFTVKF